MKRIICSNCYFRWHFQKEDWCKLIEHEHGGSAKANQTECDLYLKKGTEPKWLCCKCRRNVFGESSTGIGGKTWCSVCWWQKENKERKARERIKYQMDIKLVSNILKLKVTKRTAKKVVDLLR